MAAFYQSARRKVPPEDVPTPTEDAKAAGAWPPRGRKRMILGIFHAVKFRSDVSRSSGPMRSKLTALAFLALVAVPAAAQGPDNRFPDLEFVGADGGSVRLSQLKGNVVLLNVWATWCGPCREELPIVQRMYDRYSDRNFVVLAVNVDADRRRIEPFLKRYNISLPVYYAGPEDAGQMTAMGIPSTFILGPDRVLLDRFVGYDAGVEERWKRLLEKALKPRK